MSTTPETSSPPSGRELVGGSHMVRAYDPRVTGEVPDGPVMPPQGVSPEILKLQQEGIDMVANHPGTELVPRPIYYPLPAPSQELVKKASAELEVTSTEEGQATPGELAYQGLSEVAKKIHPSDKHMRLHLLGIEMSRLSPFHRKEQRERDQK